MKKLVLTSAFAMSVFFAQAQITINRSDIANQPTTIRYNVDENFVAPSNIEEKGNGKTWDFKGLKMDSESVIIFDDPKNYPDHSKYPTANLVIVMDSVADDIAYFEDTKDSLVLVGANDDFSDGVRFRQLIFPLSLNTTWKDKGYIQNYEAAPDGSPFDSIRFSIEFTFTNTAEAEGKIQLSGGSIDAIKVYSLGETEGTVEFLIAGTWQILDASNFSDTTYSFYSPKNGFYVLTASKNEDGTYETKYKNNDEIVGLAAINKVKQLENAVRVYPNPTTQYLNIESNKVDTYIITDILGRNIMSGKTNSNIDVSNLAKGNYMIQLFQNEKLISVNKFIKD